MDNKNEKIKVLLKKVGKEPTVEFIDNTLKAKQKLVGGSIEVVDYDSNSGILIICNEEGKILNLPPNTLFDFDYIAGDYFLVGDDYENAGFKSITDEQINKVKSDIIKRSFKYKDEDLRQIEKEMKLHNNFDSEVQESNEFFKDYIENIARPIDDISNEHIAEEYFEENINKQNDKDLEI